MCDDKGDGLIMGCSHYFFRVSKSEVENVKDLTAAELREYARQQGVELYDGCGTDESGINFLDDTFVDKEYVFDFGRLYWDDTAERICDKGVPLFSDKAVQDEFCDFDPFVVGKEGLLEAISIYQEKTKAYYEELAGATEETIRRHIAEKLSRVRNGIANISDNKWAVTSSWEYEHSIFNLVHLLKTIDWDKDTLLFYGS